MTEAEWHNPMWRIARLEGHDEQLADRVRELEEEVDRLQQQINRINSRLQADDDRRRRAAEMSMRNVK